MKLHVALCYALVLAALSFLTCTQADTVLRYTDHEPYGNMRTRAINDIFFAAIEKESQGRVRIEAHWNGELSTSYNALHTVQVGEKADIGIVVPEYTPKQLPLYQIFKSFPVGPASGEKQAAFFQHVFHDVPEFEAELAKNNLINLQFFLGYPAAFFSTSPVTPLGNLQGTTWRTASFWHQAYLENAGGKVIKMPWNAQITEALNAGALNGLLVNLDSGDDIQAQKAAKYIQLSPQLWLGHVYLLTINKARWEALPAEDKAAIQRAAASTQRKIGPLLDASLRDMAHSMQQSGASITWLSPTQLQAWQQASRYQQVQEQWVAEQVGQGVSESGHVLARVTTLLHEAMR
ncbi:TRAP transporter substrate-binding protein DctP [Kluyvera sp. STS39-E]|uniref:TRAP transporter substrate-binding protein DctP n=1 Tax=Kluyvera sp. STS39-E TaxID=3234748 RepID=UPI0034C6703A